MVNLTKGKNLVFELPDWNPRPGHVLVVYRKRKGLELYAVLPEGKAFQPTLLDRLSEFVVYGVKKAGSLLHEFSWSCMHVDGVHFYVLRCSLTFRIDKPEKLVYYLEEDPLMMLENEAKRLFTSTTRTMPWLSIARESREFTLAPNTESEDQDHVIRTNLEILQNCASQFGIEVANASLSRSLPDEDDTVRSGRVWIDANVDREKALAAREGRLIEVGTEAAVRAAQDQFSAAPTLESFTKVDRNVREIGRPNAAFSHDPQVRIGPGSNGGARPTLRNDPSTAGLSNLLEQILAVLEAVSSGSPARRALGSGLLHVVAEAFKGDEVDLDTLDRYVALADEASQALMDNDELGSENWRLVQSLLNTDSLVRRLS